MTLEEKIGQMNQYNGDWDATGSVVKRDTYTKSGVVIAGVVIIKLNHKLSGQEYSDLVRFFKIE